MKPSRPAPPYSFAFGAYALWGFVLGYGLAFASLLPAVYYLPELGQWTFNPPATAISMRWYGILLWALAGAGIGQACERVLSVSSRRGLLWVAVLAAAGLMLYIVVHEGVRWGLWRP